MKPKFRPLIAAFAPLSRSSLIVVASLCAVASANAASGTWSATPADAVWNNNANWSGATFPNAVTETATFSNAITTFGGSANPVTPSAAVNVQNLTFSGSAGPYVVGVNGAFGIVLRGTGTGSTAQPTFGNSINIAAAVTNPQIVAAPLSFSAPSSTTIGYAIKNLSTTTSATLTVSGAITTNTAGNRNTSLSLDGTNTGGNTISGVITATGTTVNPGPIIQKVGSGRWILSAANNLSSNGMTSTSGTQGVQVSAGVLSVQNNQSLGTSATSGNYKTWINSGGTLELANSITLDNGVTLNLNSGGTLLATGAITSNAIVKLSSAAATSATISTSDLSDIFTIGNAANDLTGGASDTVLNVSGPGTISLPQASNYAGGWSINSGTVQIGNNTALGATTAASISFGASSSGKLVLKSFSPTVVGLSTNATPGSPVIENGTSGTSLLTVNNTADQTFAGSLNDGASGVLALTKGGAGSLTLSGANAYTGATIVTAGTLKINNSAATASVTVSGVSTLGGTGTIAGAVTINGPSHLAPGNSVGTLTMGSLTIASGSILDYEFAGSNDKAVVTTTSGLTINGGGFNLYQEGGTTQFSTVGTYNLIQYSGTLNGSVSNLSVLNPDATKNYAFSADGTHVNLAITASVISQWGLATGGSWASTGSWTGSGVPNASGTTAIFGNVLTLPDIVVLNGDKTVATIAFDNANSYTISPATTESLYLDNTVNSGQAQIIGTNGSHQITAPVVLTSNTVANVANSGDTITLSGIVSGGGNLSKGGPGTLVLSGANTYTGDTTISNGTLGFAAGSLGAGTTLSIGGGTLQWAGTNTEDVSASRAVTFLAGDAKFDTNGNAVTFSSPVGNSGAGGLVKTGAGSLSLASGNLYSGYTVISAGTLTISDDSALGSVPGAATPGSLTIGAGTLDTAGSLTISANRGIALTSASSAINLAAAATINYGGIVDGSGKLNLSGAGTLGLSTTNTYSGGTLINTGATLNLSGAGTTSSGQVALAGGTLSISRGTYTQTNVFVDAAQTGTVDGLADRVSLGGLSGSGNVTLISRFGGTNATASGFGFRLVSGSGGFTGTVNLKSGTAATVNTFAAQFNGSNFDGNYSGATINMTDNARLAGVNNSGGNTMTIGALTGDTTAILAGADYAGTNTYNIGGKNLDTTFAGIISNGSSGNANIIKSGTGKLTLTGGNTYFGTTTVNAGTLAVENATALGADTTGTTIAGGDVNSKVTITGGLNVTEPWTLAGRQLTNADSPHIVSLSGSNILSGLVSPATSGSNYNVGCDAGTLTMSGNFTPTGAVTGTRYLQLLGAANGEWSGSIQNGTATVFLNCKGTGTWTLSGNNTYTGDTTIEIGSSLALATTGHLKFAPGANGISGRVTGDGTANLNGIFDIDLTAAELLDSNSWTLVNVSSVTYGANFTVDGFTESGTTWTKVDGAKTWTFDETTGELSLALAGYSAWASLNGASADFNADHDSDGVSNGIEYFIGGPTGNTTGFTAVPGVVTSSGLSVTWTHAAGYTGVYGTDYVVETSTTLGDDWTPVVVAAGPGNVTITGNDVKYTFPTGPVKTFARLKVQN